MRHQLLSAMALSMLGTVPALGADVPPQGEPWFLEGSPRSSGVTEQGEPTVAEQWLPSLLVARGTRWDAPRFGSGLEEDTPICRPGVFWESGLELEVGSAEIPSGVLRFGSGLEELSQQPPERSGR